PSNDRIHSDIGRCFLMVRLFSDKQRHSVFIHAVFHKAERLPKSHGSFFFTVNFKICRSVFSGITFKGFKTVVPCSAATELRKHPEIQNEAFSVLAFKCDKLGCSDSDAVSQKIYHM